MGRRSYPVCIIAAFRSSSLFRCCSSIFYSMTAPTATQKHISTHIQNGINRYRISSRDVGFYKGQTKRFLTCLPQLSRSLSTFFPTSGLATSSTETQVAWNNMKLKMQMPGGMILSQEKERIVLTVWRIHPS